MKYIAPVEQRHETSVAEGDPGADGMDDLQIIELGSRQHDVVRARSRRWAGVLVGLAVAITGFGFVCHGSGPPVRGPAGEALGAPASLPVTPRGVDGASERVSGAPDATEQPVIVTAPADGATVTSGVIMTGGVVVVDAVARRALGLVHASISIDELLLGARDLEVPTIGPFQFTIPVFPPPFAAPVTLRMRVASSGGDAASELSRAFRLNIPSAVGFWDASPTGLVDPDGRLEVRVRGYGPVSARTVVVAIRDARGHDVATGSAAIAIHGDLQGAEGGGVLGLGSFGATLWLPPGSAGASSLQLTWRDAATGARLHMETALPEVTARPVAPGSGV